MLSQVTAVIPVLLMYDFTLSKLGHNDGNTLKIWISQIEHAYKLK